VLVSGIFQGARKILFQSILFAIAFAIALHQIIADKDLLGGIWNDYVALSDEDKLALAVAMIGFAYFGGALYIAGVTVGEVPEEIMNDTPGSIDSCVTFVVPSDIPSDDKKLFEWIFDRYA
jgi:hypothetical protein